MNDTVAKIVRLQRVAQRWSVDPDPDSMVVGGHLLDWLTFDLSIEDALTISTSWRDAYRVHRRDEAIREIAARHFPGSSVRARAEKVASACREYERTGWKTFDPARGRPVGLQGEIHDALMISDIPGKEAIRKIIAHKDG